MIIKSFKNLKKREWVIFLISVVSVVVSNVLSQNVNPVMVLGSVIGVTGLIFVARGDVLGQILTVIFSILYAVVSYEMHYYGEMITYLGMTMPIAGMSVVSWLKNPYEKGKNEVKIRRLTKRKKIFSAVAAALVTWIFYYILKFFNTANLAVSTVSVTTSFLASAYMYLRSPGYALWYMANDIVIILLWVLAAFEDFSNLPMVVCFCAFLLNDIYGFISWKSREREQRKKLFDKKEYLL